MRRLFLLIFCSILVLQVANAQEDANVVLALRDISTNDVITNVVAEVRIDERSMAVTQYVDEENPLGLVLADGDYSVTILADRPFTDGKDYFKMESVTVSNTLAKSIYLYPVGSLRGIVKDAFDNVVGEADLRFECANDIGAEFPSSTSNFGSFMVDSMPVGSCKIFANLGEAVGFTEVDVEQGNIAEVEIMLDKTIIFEGSGIRASEVLAFLLIVAIVAYVGYKLLKQKPAKAKKIVHRQARKTEKKEAKEKGSRARDLLKTLNSREKKIVEHLMQQKGEVLQSNVRHNTGVPRTSLSRILKSLEAKNILQVKSVGKVVKIGLSDWFLEKE